jgi:hypothetical protein
MSKIATRATVGDLALQRCEDGFAFAIVTEVDANGLCASSLRSKSVSAEPIRGAAFAVGPAADLVSDVQAIVDAITTIFPTAIEAQRAVRAWLAANGGNNSPAAKKLDRVKGIKE